ncbi:MAG: selenocysteine-specific translation elongation factor, partial [Oscillospiraceae bacterium]
MANSIIGTAGHVDHGKTCLIKALTGIQTDRLKEEKKRGITIDLGFAHLDMPDGTQAGIIDVPGHEKFVRNMLAGASGIDLVLLVIAADEGIMPQTKEHLDILSLLNVKKGIVAVTKIDMVEEEWLSFMEEEIKKGLEGTFLENADMCFVSSYTGEGIDNLRQKLFDMLLQQKNDKDEQAFRLPIDRVFSVEGIGTVITG